ncbi:MAG TPA: oligosaccharide flippase family protein [Casimicrobiaceae bacterium]|nr:oligosaccharide flippase family protein [Casimicrobiaceae bacterium]
MKLFRGYAVLAAGQTASRLLGLFAFAWLARVLEPDAYGAAEYVIGIALLAGTLVDGGSGSVGVSRAARDPGDLSGLAFQILVVRLIFAVAAVPVVFGVALSGPLTIVPKALAWLFAVSLLAAPWRHEWLFQATERMGSVAAAQVIRAGVFAGLVWLLVHGPGDLVAVGWAEIGAVAALTGYCVYIQHTRITPLRLTGSLGRFWALVKESATAGAANGVWAMAQYAPLLAIGIAIGGAQTAWFAAAARVVGSLMVLPYVYHYGLYPAVARAAGRGGGELRRLLSQSCRVAAWGGVFVALALTLFAGPFIVMVMGPRLEPSAPILRVMAWVLPVALCSGHARWTLTAVGAQSRVLWAQLAGLGAVVTVALLLGPVFEAVAYALAAVAGALTLWILAHFFAARAGLHPPPFTLLLKPAALGAALLLGVRLTGAGPWLSVAGLGLYVLAAPVIDRSLVRDIAAFGRTARAAGAGGDIEPGVEKSA